MTKEQFNHEMMFSVTMTHARKMFADGLITRKQYWAFLTKMRAKYLPISGGLVYETDLLSQKIRA